MGRASNKHTPFRVCSSATAAATASTCASFFATLKARIVLEVVVPPRRDVSWRGRFLVLTRHQKFLGAHAYRPMGAGKRFTPGGLRIFARRFVDATTGPQLQLVSAGVTMRKEDAFAQQPARCELQGSASYGQPRPANEDAYFIASPVAQTSFMTHESLQPGLRGIIGYGGANAAGVADGVGGYWAQHGVSAGKASAEMARICSDSLSRGATLEEAIAVGHSRLVDPTYLAADGCTTFAAYQVRGERRLTRHAARVLRSLFVAGSNIARAHALDCMTCSLR